MQKGNTEGARIHAEAAIRNQNQSLQYLKLEGRLESVAAKLLEKQKMDMVRPGGERNCQFAHC